MLGLEDGMGVAGIRDMGVLHSGYSYYLLTTGLTGLGNICIARSDEWMSCRGWASGMGDLNCLIRDSGYGIPGLGLRAAGPAHRMV